MFYYYYWLWARCGHKRGHDTYIVGLRVAIGCLLNDSLNAGQWRTINFRVSLASFVLITTKTSFLALECQFHTRDSIFQWKSLPKLLIFVTLTNICKGIILLWYLHSRAIGSGSLRANTNCCSCTFFYHLGIQWSIKSTYFNNISSKLCSSR